MLPRRTCKRCGRCAGSLTRERDRDAHRTTPRAATARELRSGRCPCRCQAAAHQLPRAAPAARSIPHREKALGHSAKCLRTSENVPFFTVWARTTFSFTAPPWDHFG
eukprot:7385608-Prymnesium_polylepis.3